MLVMVPRLMKNNIVVNRLVLTDSCQKVTCSLVEHGYTMSVGTRLMSENAIQQVRIRKCVVPYIGL